MKIPAARPSVLRVGRRRAATTISIFSVWRGSHGRLGAMSQWRLDGHSILVTANVIQDAVQNAVAVVVTIVVVVVVVGVRRSPPVGLLTEDGTLIILLLLLLFDAQQLLPLTVELFDVLAGSPRPGDGAVEVRVNKPGPLWRRRNDCGGGGGGCLRPSRLSSAAEESHSEGRYFCFFVFFSLFYSPLPLW